MTNVRKTTNALLEAVEQGALDPTVALKMALTYMSESEVADMVRINDIFQDDPELLDE
jgi:hypothetical protein